MTTEFIWPVDLWGNRKAINKFTNLEQVRYHVYLARIETTSKGNRNIPEEILYLLNWSNYWRELVRANDFDPEALKYLEMEIVRLYQERFGWH